MIGQMFDDMNGLEKLDAPLLIGTLFGGLCYRMKIFW
jgi:hypothetical protein